MVRSLKEFGNPLVDLLEPKPYTALQSIFDPWSRTAGTATGSRSSSRRSQTTRSTRSSNTPRPNLAEVLLHRLPARWRPRPRGNGRDRVQPARRGPRREHQRRLDRGRPRRASDTSPGRATSSRRCSRTRATTSTSTFSAMREPTGSPGLRRRQLRAPGRAQARVRPDELLPAESEHRARHGHAAPSPDPMRRLQVHVLIMRTLELRVLG